MSAFAVPHEVRRSNSYQHVQGCRGPGHHGPPDSLPQVSQGKDRTKGPPQQDSRTTGPYQLLSAWTQRTGPHILASKQALTLARELTGAALWSEAGVLQTPTESCCGRQAHTTTPGGAHQVLFNRVWTGRCTGWRRLVRTETSTLQKLGQKHRAEQPQGRSGNTLPRRYRQPVSWNFRHTPSRLPLKHRGNLPDRSDPPPPSRAQRLCLSLLHNKQEATVRLQRGPERA